MMKENEFKSFHINLPLGQDQFNVPKLLRWVIRELESYKKPIYITNLNLEQPASNGDCPGMYVSYFIKSKADLEKEAEYRQDAEEFKASAPVQTIEYFGNQEFSKSLNGYTLRLQQGEQQGNSLLLLEEVAKSIEKLGEVTVTDLVYHDYFDEDSLDHPFVRVYYLT